ncbi:MAG: hypothetical protein O2890_13005 [Cyanobacteria bacterium]|nr:hypothetical protein [Cyanobacteriota bacterium]MDA0867307.1 hypothetical protein [Cyanobacteriota bacterium]
MPRLNHRAYTLLADELKRLVKGPLEEVRRDIVLRRLTKFTLQEGTPLTYGEIKAAIEDIFPEFKEAVLHKAARANRSSMGKFGLIKTALLGLTVSAGGLWVLNLPYPMIRWPVARVAPIVLLPSYISMDHSYRQAISLVEQADQLVNQATSTQDIELGVDKVTQAQKHLDRLPVWFLGYFPKTYCTFAGCTWRFTLDEFQAARKAVGRMEAKIFQEQNAFTLLDQGTSEVDAAKAQYQAAPTTEEKTAAAIAWQAGMDKLNEIPAETLAGRQAQTKLNAYGRDFEQVAGLLAGGSRSSTLIDAAKQFAWTASTEAQNPPHSQENWQRFMGLWQQAIDRLEKIAPEDAGYDEAQAMLAEYTNNLGIVQGKLTVEKTAVAAWDIAQSRNTNLWGRSGEMSPGDYAREVQSIIYELKKIESGTTPYEEAQILLRSLEAELQKAAP